MRNEQKPQAILHPEAWADLQASGLTAETVDRCKLVSVSAGDLNKCHIPGVIHALAFPYHGHDGLATDFERWKLFYDGDRNDRPKYWQPKDSDPRLYLPPLCDWQVLASDPTHRLLISEGEKKSLAASQLGWPCIGVGGVWNWRAKLDNGKRLILPALDQFIWKGRTVELVPDPDAWREDKQFKILAGFYALGMELNSRGARVQFVKLPE